MSGRIRRVSLLLVITSGVLAGCGATVDLAKATFSRTTVPAASGGTSGGTPKPGDPAFTAEKLRTIDACALLDANTLSSVGTPSEDTPTSDFSECSNFMKDPAGKDLNISLTLGEGLVGDPADAEGSVGGLPAIQQELNDKTACFQTAVTETSPHRGIRVQVGGTAADKCDAGRKVLQAVVDRVRTDPPTYGPTAGTVRELDPCAVVAEAEVIPALGAGIEVEPTDLHWCTWSADGADVWIWMHIGVDPAKSIDAGNMQQVDVGLPAMQQSDSADGAKCDVEWSHLPVRGSLVEVISVSFIRYTPRAGEDPCEKARSVARTLVPKLPKK